MFLRSSCTPAARVLSASSLCRVPAACPDPIHHNARNTHSPATAHKGLAYIARHVINTLFYPRFLSWMAPYERGEQSDRPYQPRDDGVRCEAGPRVLGARRRLGREAHARVVRVRRPVLRRRT